MRAQTFAIALALVFLVIIPGFVKAQEEVGEKKDEKVDDGTIMKGFSADDEKKLVSFIILAGILLFHA